MSDERLETAVAPLFLVGGPSGAGKSTARAALIGRLPEVVLLESDVLWRDEFRDDAGEFFDTWLRVCESIAETGRAVALFGAGFAVPDNVEERVQRDRVAGVHYLALVCDDQALARRLRARPAWRDSSRPEYIAEHTKFNRWLRERDAGETPAIERFDTTEASELETATQIAEHIRSHLSPAAGPMLSHVSLAVSDLERSGAVYDAALSALGYVRVWTADDAIGYGPPGGDDKLAIKQSTEALDPDRRTHVALHAPTTSAVAEFHSAAVAAGARDNGAPGPRPRYGRDYFAAFVVDPDGNHLEAKLV